MSGVTKVPFIKLILQLQHHSNLNINRGGIDNSTKALPTSVLYSSQMILFDIFFLKRSDALCRICSFYHLPLRCNWLFLVSCSWYRWCFWAQAFIYFIYFYLLLSIVKPFCGLLCNTSATTLYDLRLNWNIFTTTSHTPSDKTKTKMNS